MLGCEPALNTSKISLEISFDRENLLSSFFYLSFLLIINKQDMDFKENQNIGTMDVLEKHQFDLEALNTFMKEETIL